mmetsp:Transcript_6048/g.13372  ORF Transcript_6048/g.13372 Transcript_6048/m.13372 type:complete len:281 (-) Transcript_6048:1-843(-)
MGGAISTFQQKRNKYRCKSQRRRMAKQAAESATRSCSSSSVRERHTMKFVIAWDFPDEISRPVSKGSSGTGSRLLDGFGAPPSWYDRMPSSSDFLQRQQSSSSTSRVDPPKQKTPSDVQEGSRRESMSVNFPKRMRPSSAASKVSSTNEGRRKRSAKVDSGQTDERPSSAHSRKAFPPKPAKREGRPPTPQGPAPPLQPPPSLHMPRLRSGLAAESEALRCLGLSAPVESLEELRRAYRQAALKCHPDRPQNHGMVDEATQKFQALCEAFDFLKSRLPSG